MSLYRALQCFISMGREDLLRGTHSGEGMDVMMGL